MKHVTVETFEAEVLKAEKPVLVDFWASWCGPCQMMAPVLEQLEEKRSDFEIVKINVDEQMPLAMQYKVASIPMFLLFEQGEVKGKALGYMAAEELLAALNL